MSKAVILQHAPHEGPGRIVSVFRDFGIPTETRHLYRGDPVPADLSEIRALVVLGGPMNVSDAGTDRCPFLAAELDLVRKAIDADLPYLGICLGAQFLAAAAGAKVYPNLTPSANGQPGEPAPEIGWGPVSFPFPGGVEPIVMGLHDGAMMFHWHFQTFDLPKLPPPPNPPPPPAVPPAGSALLSSTRACRNQAFRFKDRMFGFQYHIELEPAGIQEMLSGNRDDWVRVLGPEGEHIVRRDTERYYGQFQRLGNRVLENFVQYLKVY